jgi:hypothetical protein
VIVRESNTIIIPPIHKNLRIAKFLVFTVLKDSIVAHRSIKIHKLPKIYVCENEIICGSMIL